MTPDVKPNWFTAEPVGCQHPRTRTGSVSTELGPYRFEYCAVEDCGELVNANPASPA